MTQLTLFPDDALLQRLIAALQSHDQYYMYSDDPSVHRQGLKTQDAIYEAWRNMTADGRGDEATKIVHHYNKATS